jgi:hypothetical protein
MDLFDSLGNPWLLSPFRLLFFFFNMVGLGFEQRLALAKEALYHLSHTSSPQIAFKKHNAYEYKGNLL